MQGPDHRLLTVPQNVGHKKAATSGFSNSSLATTTASTTDTHLEALISPPYTPLLSTQALWDPKTSLCSADQVILEQEQPSPPLLLSSSTTYTSSSSSLSSKKTPLSTSNSINQVISQAHPASIPTYASSSTSFPSSTSISTGEQPSAVVSAANNRKRKGSLPHRAISPPRDQVDRSFQRIVTLDVYAAFKANPANLLNRRKSSSSSHESDSDTGGFTSRKSPTLSCSTLSANATGFKKPGSGPGNQSACKVLPSFIKEKERNNMSLAPYKNTFGATTVSWKGAQPLNITTDMVNFEDLTSEEVRTCATLRILPNQYIEIKKTLLTAVETYGPFKKREAQTWFRIDVNKICIIYDWFKTLGWIPNTDEWASTGDVGKKPNGQSDQKKKVKKR